MLEQQLKNELDTFFKSDPHWIEHSLKVYRFARDIGAELGADDEIVMAAAILHDVGIRVSLEKYGDYAPAHQEAEGPPVAEEILKKIHFPEDKISHVLEIVGNHHSPGKVTSQEFNAVYDADLIVNIEEGNFSKEEHPPFLTAQGKKYYRSL